VPFNENRAKAFAEYTVTALLDDKSGKILTISRYGLAEVLAVEKLWDKHIDVVREYAAKWNVGTANLGNTIAFVSLEKNVEPMKVDYATHVTNKFAEVYGSEAADTMWETGEYRKGFKGKA
jgi:hypothetical protein